MATSGATLPPMGKICTIGIWIETVLYGVNCVMYGLCMFILLRGGKVPTLRWVLLVICTMLFLLCTVFVGASLQQLLDAFVYVPDDVPDYSTIYWLDYTTTPSVLKGILYATLMLGKESMLIWRLYVVFLCDLRVVVFPIILAAGCVGIPYAISALTVLQNLSVYDSVVSDLVIATLVLDMILNVSVTVTIAGRLWWMGRKLASLTDARVNKHTSSIYVVVESGAIFMTASIVILALYVSNSPVFLAGLDIAAQLAALTPLLIAVQVGLAGRYHIPSGDSSGIVLTVQEEITFPFRVGVPREEDSQQDPSLHTLSRSPSSAHDAHARV